MRKAIFIFLLSFVLMSNVPVAWATPPANELNQYLAEIGWTKQDLMNYLNFYEMPLEGFSTLADLKNALGTPVNAKNLQDLLSKYHLSQTDLNNLLKQFGDSLDKYKFIEDLNNTLAFYTNHDNVMARIKMDMAKIGITSKEADRFFSYLTQIEEDNKTQLDQMQSLDYQIDKFLGTVDPSQLNAEQLDELSQIFKQTLNLYEIQLKLKANNKNITLDDLLKMKISPGNLYTGVYSNAGEPLLDFTIPAKAFQGVVAGLEELLNLGGLANEFVDYMHSEKYNDINPYK
ncbi:processed acidic surface protein [Neobacillus ginsengisoli]|uniref:Processed acidic surface protein n=1 Tax=Neobacillus ginsengisoli TaxID=904295 RepID=A0ABT9XXX4_9BACI|nr:processed acidic surface protein [Neobacillus ginsengisoli]MDQ0200418.1 processed acidic surface protein [Neobacillus ginsengisoli]